MDPTSGPDPEQVETFSDRMIGILNGGALSLMLSLGHRAGLFDVMDRFDWASSGPLAEEAGLCERYVREWLGAMVAGSIVEYDATRAAYRLPPAHAALLTRRARPNNLASTAQWIPLLGAVEDEILACFERGGGVSRDSFVRFHEVMAEESDQSVVAALLDGILPAVPGAVEVLERGADVLDVGCGSGRALQRMARAFPRSRFTGHDLSAPGIAAARAGAAQDGLANLRFEVRDVADLESVRAFDLVTAFGSIHDQVRPDVVLRAIARALKPGGVFLMQEVGGSSHLERDAALPLAPFFYTVSCLHCTAVSLAGGGAGLGAMWGAETALRMLDAAGFAKVEVKRLPHDRLHHYYVARTRA
jgi:2-polyprenyl-3-methyl-5-hydroxy-6-metoxy-1,4-benzoquinol methylase